MALPIQPPLSPIPMGVELQAYTLINFAVPAERLAGLVPELFVLDTTERDGVPMAWLSVWMGRVVTRWLGPFPALPLHFTQVNFRTYVQLEQGNALYIFRSVIGAEP